MEEMFDSAVNLSEDFAGVFEFDGEVGYFYLYQIDEREGNKILGATHIVSGKPEFSEEDIKIKWNTTDKLVGLFIKNTLWAVFNCSNDERFGGDYRSDAKSSIPEEIIEEFS